MFVIGLMGGIASGKTNISRYLEKRGAKIIDADMVARDLQKCGAAGHKKLREEFGDEFFGDDGELLRAALGAYVFGNAERMQRLNDAMLPLIDEEIAKRINDYREKGTSLVVIDAAILYESTAIKLCDEVWVAFANKEERIRRIQERNGLDRENANARIESQKEDAELIGMADRIITTEGTIEQTRAIVDGYIREISQNLKSN